MKEHYLSPKEIQDIEFDILKAFDRLCKKYNLYYSLTYGTMIGAIRHGGFIPWDDDVDVMMPRNDYDKLIDIVRHDEEIRKNYVLLHDGQKGYYYPFYKLCDVRTVAKADDNITRHGLWIDIFPVDSVYEDEQRTKKLHKQFRLMKNTVLSYTTDFRAKHKNWKFIPKFFLSVVAHIYGIDRLVAKIEKKARVERSKNKVSVLTWQSSTAGNMEKDDFYNSVLMSFEGTQLPVIKKYDASKIPKYDSSAEIQAAGFDISVESKKLEHYYENCLSDKEMIYELQAKIHS